MMDDICSFLDVKYIGSISLSVMWINIAVCIELDRVDDCDNISIVCTRRGCAGVVLVGVLGHGKEKSCGVLLGCVLYGVCMVWGVV